MKKRKSIEVYGFILACMVILQGSFVLLDRYSLKKSWEAGRQSLSVELERDFTGTELVIAMGIAELHHDKVTSQTSRKAFLITRWNGGSTFDQDEYHRLMMQKIRKSLEGNR